MAGTAMATDNIPISGTAMSTESTPMSGTAEGTMVSGTAKSTAMLGTPGATASVEMTVPASGTTAATQAVASTPAASKSPMPTAAATALPANTQAATPVATSRTSGLLTETVTAAAPVLTDMDRMLEALYTRVNPAVVNITSISGGANTVSATPDPFAPDGGVGTGVALGSGFVIDMAGHIVTNNHVVSGANRVIVTFADGTEAAATVVGASQDADLAVLKVDVDASELHPLPLGSSNSLKVGQTVVAIGNPFGLAGSMSIGIVSGLGRTLADGGTTANGQSFSIPDIVQTDAAINPGNSGGPLLDLAGNVIGVNTAIESAVRSNSGVGYAIPADLVASAVPALIQSGEYHLSYLGISGGSLSMAGAQAMNLPDTQHGVLVVSVTPGGPADQAGLQGGSQETTVDGLPAVIGGDVIVAIDGQPINHFDELLSYLVRHTKAGDQVTLSILRNGQPMDLKVTLGARPTSP